MTESNKIEFWLSYWKNRNESWLLKWCYMTHSLDWLWMIRMVVNDKYENEMMLYDTLSRLAVNDKDGSK